jgi:arylsulfatase A-like enzyme/Tfp pilus assembly protein PilF
MNRPSGRFLAPVLLVLVLAVSCSGTTSGPEGILLITLDTTRADRLGCYGYGKAQTPNLDAFALENALFLDAMSPVPVTLPSHASMFTGEYPITHGVRYNGMFRLSEDSVTIAELLRDAGWATAAVAAAYPVKKATGLAQGFQLYRDPIEDKTEDKNKIPERKADEVSDIGIEWLRSRPDGPFFLWLHYFDPHDPYKPPFPYSSRHRGRPYDGEIAFTDFHVGRVFEELKAQGLWDDMLIVIAGDHGEGLYDHGEKLHSYLVYQSTQHVPLLIHTPGGADSRKVEAPVSIIDIAATILDYAGVPVPEMTAETLRPYLEGERTDPRVQYFESLSGSLACGWSPLEGVRDGRWKYIRSVDPELYDLEEDPGEEVNLYEMEGDIADGLDALLEDVIRAGEETAVPADAREVPLDPEEMDRLAALGYIGGTMAPQRKQGASPRDLIHLESSFNYAGMLDRRGAHRESMPIWRNVLEADPDNRHALHNAARASMRLGMIGDALGYVGRLLEIYPEFQPGWVTLGEIHVSAGKYGDAAKAFREGLEQHPGESALTYRLAAALLAQGKVREAEEQALQALGREMDDAAASFRVILAVCQADRGEPELARESLQRAIREGYAKRGVLEEEPLVAPLRKVPGFEEIVATIPAEEE